MQGLMTKPLALIFHLLPAAGGHGAPSHPSCVRSRLSPDFSYCSCLYWVTVFCVSAQFLRRYLSSLLPGQESGGSASVLAHCHCWWWALSGRARGNFLSGSEIWSLYDIYIILERCSASGPYFLSHISFKLNITRFLSHPMREPCGFYLAGAWPLAGLWWGQMSVCEHVWCFIDTGVYGSSVQCFQTVGKGIRKESPLAEQWRTGGLVAATFRGVVVAVSKLKAALGCVMRSDVSCSLSPIFGRAHLLLVIIPHPSSNLLFWGEAWWLNFLKVEVTIQTLILVKGSMRGHLLGVRFLVARPGPSAVHVHLWLCSKWFLLLEVTLLNWFKLLISDVPSLTVGTIGV